MSRTLLALPSHLRRRLLSALEAGLLAPPYREEAVRAALAGGVDAEQVSRALREQEQRGASPQLSASWLRAFEEVSGGASTPDLVWSGPETPGLHARKTRSVYEDLLGSAERSLLVTTFAFFDGPRAFRPLAARLDERPGLSATLLLNIQRSPENRSSTPDSLVRRFASRFWEEEWPGSRHPRIFYDPRSLEPGAPAGVLHAKAVVADGKTVFITSANLTEAALERNIEIGLLVRDRALAVSVTSHFEALIHDGRLAPLPAS